jgi:F-type H+-transporting ATPase subunit c
MTKKTFLMLLALFLLASFTLCAQQGQGTPGYPSMNGHWVPVSAAFAMAIGSSLCGLAQGKAIAAAVEGMARNPGAAKAIQLAMLIGLAFIESLALYVLLIIYTKVS